MASYRRSGAAGARVRAKVLIARDHTTGRCQTLPVILNAGDYDRWQFGTPEEAKVLCAGYLGEVTVDRTEEPWRRS